MTLILWDLFISEKWHLYISLFCQLHWIKLTILQGRQLAGNRTASRNSVDKIQNSLKICEVLKSTIFILISSLRTSPHVSRLIFIYKLFITNVSTMKPFLFFLCRKLIFFVQEIFTCSFFPQTYEELVWFLRLSSWRNWKEFLCRCQNA